MAERGEFGVEVKGLREFRRDLKRLDTDADKELRASLREGGQGALGQARTDAPHLTGQLARSLRLSVTARQVSIYSTLPQAAVLHWGGTIRPRGVPIVFPRTEFLSRAVTDRADEITENVAESVERAARSAGWH